MLNWQDRQLTLPAMAGKIRSANLFADKSAVKFVQSPEDVVLTMTTAPALDVIDTIIELELDTDLAKK